MLNNVLTVLDQFYVFPLIKLYCPVFLDYMVLTHVTSDHSPKFISHFFCSLRKALDMKLHFTSGYHLAGDGQTKQTNQTLEQYLWIFCKTIGIQGISWVQVKLRCHGHGSHRYGCGFQIPNPRPHHDLLPQCHRFLHCSDVTIKYTKFQNFFPTLN